MISFFALVPEPSMCRRIGDWRERSLPPLEHPVHPANLHITLAYLGETRNWQLDRLINDPGHADFRPLELSLDHLGYWPKPRVLWLGGSVVDARLLQLEKRLRNLAGALGLATDKRPFHPHLTLARKLSYPPPAATTEPYFELRFDEFVLMESRRTPHGVGYEVLERFS